MYISTEGNTIYFSGYYPCHTTLKGALRKIATLANLRSDFEFQATPVFPAISRKTFKKLVQFVVSGEKGVIEFTLDAPLYTST